MSGFQEEYAAIYDLLYTEKNYEEESQLVRKVIDEFRPDAKILLDYGCGTGNHAKEFASHGFDVWGLDKNESMLKIARERLRDVPNIELRHVENRDLIPPGSVDVCTTLFDVISYMNTNEEVIDFLSYVRRILVKKGLLVFDFWYGPSVIALGPEKRWKEFDLGERSLLRLTSPQHDRDACVVTVTHEVVLSENERIVSRFSDVHRMRYFFPNEIRLFLVHQGLELLKIGTWQDLDTPPKASDWSALAVARVVE